MVAARGGGKTMAAVPHSHSHHHPPHRLRPVPRAHRVAAHYFHEKIQTTQKTNSRMHRNLAPLLQEQGNNRQALKHLKAAVSFNPIDIDARNDFGLALLSNGRRQEAIAQFKAALNIDETHSCALKNLSAAHARKGEYKEAIKYAKKTVKLFPRDAQAHRNLAKLFDAIGNARDSFKHNQLAVSCGPGVQLQREYHDTQAYRKLAIQLAEHGHRSDAHAHYDAHRALAGKRMVLANTEQTKELLERTRTVAI